MLILKPFVDVRPGTVEQKAKCDLLEIVIVYSSITRQYTVLSKLKNMWLRSGMVGELGRYAPNKWYFGSIDEAINTAARYGNDETRWY
jgi:hypothetical protein